MSLLIIITAISVAIAAISATPAEAPEAGCTITSLSEVSSVVSRCQNIIVQIAKVPGGKALELDLKDGSTVTFRGTTKFEYYEWEGPMVLIKGNRITVEGESGSILDGQGALYWDGKGEERIKKPKFFRMMATGGSVFKNIHLLNCPISCASIQASDHLTVSGWTIDNAAGHVKARNTDGFGISGSQNILVENSSVENQDDCVVVNLGSNIHLKNVHCSGGHGLSLSVGFSKTSESQNELSDVTFEDCSVSNSRFGIHVKVHTNVGPGAVKRITYKNIKLSGILYWGINVQQDYGSEGHPATNIPITDLNLSGITGSMKGPHAMPVYIMCGSNACSNWNWSGISITGGHKKSSCNYRPSGFSC